MALGLLMLVGCGTTDTSGVEAKYEDENIPTAVKIKKLEEQRPVKVEYGEGATDVDGNIYKSVRIGKQEWMSQNLNVDHFRNGDIIPEAKTKEEWVRAGEENQPAWCYYDNNISNGEKYGKLYNFYAVIDTRGLAPYGWHVPSDAEWTSLTDYLSVNGHSGTEGTDLKATSDWKKGGNGTDDYGWLGLPGGSRNLDGPFYDVGCFGYWWSSSQYSAGSALGRGLNNVNDYVYRVDGNKEYGFSVRCLRD